MAKKSPNAALIDSLTPAKPLPYDPALMQVMAAAADRSWQKLEALRRELYRIVMPTVWVDVFQALRDKDDERLQALEIQADRVWQRTTGLLPLTSFKNVDAALAAVAAVGYPETDAGLMAWTIARNAAVAPPQADGPYDGRQNSSAEHSIGDPIGCKFVPNKFQRAILDALAGRALNKQQLADMVCGGEGSRLYKSRTRVGDLNELRDKNLVEHKPRLGYFRPDVPPD